MKKTRLNPKKANGLTEALTSERYDLHELCEKCSGHANANASHTSLTVPGSKHVCVLQEK